MSVFDIDDHIAGELPNAILKVEFVGAAVVSFDSHAALSQA